MTSRAVKPVMLARFTHPSAHRGRVKNCVREMISSCCGTARFCVFAWLLLLFSLRGVAALTWSFNDALVRQSTTLKNGFDFLPNLVSMGAADNSTSGNAPGL